MLRLFAAVSLPACGCDQGSISLTELLTPLLSYPLSIHPISAFIFYTLSVCDILAQILLLCDSIISTWNVLYFASRSSIKPPFAFGAIGKPASIYQKLVFSYLKFFILTRIAGGFFAISPFKRKAKQKAFLLSALPFRLCSAHKLCFNIIFELLPICGGICHVSFTF